MVLFFQQYRLTVCVVLFLIPDNATSKYKLISQGDPVYLRQEPALQLAITVHVFITIACPRSLYRTHVRV